MSEEGTRREILAQYVEAMGSDAFKRERSNKQFVGADGMPPG
jgi:hypothetical protein